MVSAIFRMVNIHSGRILVDGLDISTIPREEIRRRLVGVPQDAFLIEGRSVRLNADPAGGLSDAAIEDALKSVDLWEIVAKKGGLGAPIEELHLSHGQKQLFCIARAIVRPSPIVILDEATSRYAFLFPKRRSRDTNYVASVDAHVDKLIQRLVREKFQGRTVISVVHKLHSALDDFGMVVVLDAGEVQEFGRPRELLAKGSRDSAFASMYNSLTG